jgi:hypothetical protein
MHVACPHCAGSIDINRSHLGQNINCPYCRYYFYIENPSKTQADKTKNTIIIVVVVAVIIICKLNTSSKSSNRYMFVPVKQSPVRTAPIQYR